MEELKILKDKAQGAFEEANPDGKRLLVNLFGIEPFCYKMTERIKTFADVLAFSGEPAHNYEVDNNDTNEVKAAMYYKRLKLIAKVLNGNWKPDLADTNQRKYYPWFQINKTGSSGFALSYNDYVYAYTNTNLGARPYFKDSETAIYAGKQFLEEYNWWAFFMNLSE